MTEPLPLEVEEYLTWLAAERGRAASTVEAYRRDLRAYVAHLRDRGLSLLDAGQDDVERFVADLEAAGLAPRTRARRVVAVRNLHRFLVDEDLAERDPVADVESPKVPRGIPKALSEDEVDRLLTAVVGDEAPARRDRAILEVLYGTGVRISELVGLSLGDVDLVAARMRVFGKGSKERVVPIGRHAGLALEAWLDEPGRPALVPRQWRRRGDAEALFLNQRGGRLSRQGAWGVVTRWGDAAGLGDRLTPHVLRHSCATHMVDHGADLRVVQELLGHASVSTTQVYTLVSTERLWAVYDAAHPRASVGAAR
ncbi:site-specific tyrosine recombinase XerD [Actinomarinicola tropica]|uniref:Tyrosine recombinase XerC n=1 Tax=Actinomarinicola tropica TaxID=2789776 RepID=A0A5Q2REJ6_9ACTN|nr:site-specific tyrosine recombinase XerD [Actinomarinicola tropica]QGG95229.1 site-specific tyrosine recombinase XerD [Actinomarinicola tropica]